MPYFEIIVGFVLLLGGAEVMVRGAVGLAVRFGISPLVIGMTIIAMGTSAPEFLVSLDATLAGVPALAIGNVVGSNIANILLILGLSGVVARIEWSAGELRRDAMILVIGTVLFVALAFRGEIDFAAGVLLVIFFAGFVVLSYMRESAGIDGAARLHLREAHEYQRIPRSLWLAAAASGGGLAALLAGADLLVVAATALAREFGVSEAVIGLSVIAVGSSLPELAASAVAAARGQSDVALGNVVGSNLFNIVGIPGVVALVSPLAVPARVLTLDAWVMLAATLLLAPRLLARRGRLHRAETAAYLLAYAAYIAALGFGVERLIPA